MALTLSFFTLCFQCLARFISQCGKQSSIMRNGLLPRNHVFLRIKKAFRIMKNGNRSYGKQAA